FYGTQFFTGLEPLLTNLRRQVTFTRRDTVHWRGHDVVLLTGVWSAPPPADQEWPAYFPRQCRLFLDPGTHWPHRVEWWGPTTLPKPGDSLIVQMEFRNPVLGQPQPDAEFVFRPGPGEPVTD